MALPVRKTARDPIDVVLTIDDDVETSWSKAERARYLALGEAPAAGLPRGATRFRVRPMGWAERARVRDACATLYSARGAELLEQYIEAMREGRSGVDDPDAAEQGAKAAGERFRLGLVERDRELLADATVMQMRHDEMICRACVVDVRESGAAGERFDEVLDALDTATGTAAITELARHIQRITRLGSKQAF